jgi:hypothetical protein
VGADMIERLQYVHGLGSTGTDGIPTNPDKAIRLRGVLHLPKVHESFARERIAELRGVLGDRAIADPTEVDFLEVTASGETIRLTVFNRGACLLIAPSEELRRIHRFLHVLLSSVEGSS